MVDFIIPDETSPNNEVNQPIKIKIAIVGASGYTGRELIRMLSGHPNATIAYASSRQHEGKKLGEVFTNLGSSDSNISNLSFSPLAEIDYSKVDLVFFALPHGEAIKEIPLALKHARVVDLSADFRIQDVTTWEQWYKIEHKAKSWIKKAVYGLTEIHSKSIQDAQLIANPGCYPTSILLATLPLIEQGVVEPEIIADCKSGTSGAGAKADLGLNLSEIGNNFKIYNAYKHRHVPEILEQMQFKGLNANLSFTANLLPIPRGMMSSIYLKKRKSVDVFSLLNQTYHNQTFIKVINQPASADIKSVLGTNCCQISVYEHQDRVLLVSVIDNLIKGASGQAIQNMNLMFDFDEAAGLTTHGIYP